MNDGFSKSSFNVSRAVRMICALHLQVHNLKGTGFSEIRPAIDAQVLLPKLPLLTEIEDKNRGQTEGPFW